MENLRLSDSDTDDLQGSPPGQHGKAFNQKVSDKDKSTSGSSRPHDSETLFDREEAREAALRDELRAIQKINEVIEGLLDSLDRAKGNMQVHCASKVYGYGRQLLIYAIRPCLEQLTLPRLYSILGPESSHKPSITSG